MVAGRDPGLPCKGPQGDEGGKVPCIHSIVRVGPSLHKKSFTDMLFSHVVYGQKPENA